ncbi:hypothetical protein L596_016104 [Steinernema carpocapsae]|uniref:Uncharacterized protein n=1 Tax=Steinernema carpocapsae TaxID=34508 RepID=A0A4U5NH05_STECR|nr:hypothetical protein L596_016104 [Steinernema carpocapsae]
MSSSTFKPPSKFAFLISDVISKSLTNRANANQSTKHQLRVHNKDEKNTILCTLTPLNVTHIHQTPTSLLSSHNTILLPLPNDSVNLLLG